MDRLEYTDLDLDHLTSSWQAVNKNVAMFTESEVERAIGREMKHRRRKDILVRLHQRFCILRDKRERQELLDALAPLPGFL